MKTKNFSLRNAARMFAVAICVCSVSFFASCGGDEPEPEPTPTVDKLERKNIELVNRTKANEAGKTSFSDATKVIGTLYTKVDEKTETKDITKENTFKSEGTWSTAAITISALTGEIAKRPTITFANNGLTFNYTAFKAEKCVTITNSTFTFTESGKSFQVTDYGFVNGEATADAVVAVTNVTEGGKNYSVTTVTQKFKIKHSDGTLSDEQTISFQNKAEVAKPKVEEVSFKATKKPITDYPDNYLYEYKLSVNGANVDFSVDANNAINSWTKPVYVTSTDKVFYCAPDLTIGDLTVSENRSSTSKWQTDIALPGNKLERKYASLLYELHDKGQFGGSKCGFIQIVGYEYRYVVAEGEYVNLSSLEVKYLNHVSTTYGAQAEGTNDAGTPIIYKDAEFVFKVQLGEEVRTVTAYFRVWKFK